MLQKNYQKFKNFWLPKMPSIFNAAFFGKCVYKGFQVYRKLCSKYGNKATFFLCPHKATGDVYIFGLYFDTFIHKNNISDYIFVTVGKGDAKVATMYSIKNIVPISQEEMDNLVRFSIFIGRKQLNIKILHYRAICMHTGVIDNLRNYKTLNFVEMLLYIVFHLDRETPQQHPDFTTNLAYIKEIFKERKLLPGKTVILSPYSNSIPWLPFYFWETLANRLSENGFAVCTNSIGSSEPVIKDTTPIFFSYDNAKPFLEYAGFFIGIRSGFCDIISSFKCKKIIINQPDIRFGVGTVINYFSLKDMGLDRAVLELEYQECNWPQIVEYILNEIKGVK